MKTPFISFPTNISHPLNFFKSHSTPLSYHQRGFSLIELMLVITIMGVLCAVGIPSYQEYLVRAKVSNMLAMAQSTKIAVTEALLTGTKPEYPKIRNQDVVKEITVADNHIITVVGDAKKLGIRPQNTDLKLVLSPTIDNPDMIYWICTVDPSELKKYAPADCRGKNARDLAAEIPTPATVQNTPATLPSSNVS